MISTRQNADRSFAPVTSESSSTDPATIDAGESTPRFPRRSAAVLVGIGGLAVVMAVATTIGIPAIERHLRQDLVAHALPPSSAVAVVVRGRDVTLRGTVPTNAERNALIGRVRSRWGVAQVDARALTVRRRREPTPKVSRAAVRPAEVVVPATIEKRTVARPATTVVTSTIAPPSTTIALDPTAPARLQATLTKIRRTSTISFAKSSLNLAVSSSASLDLVAAAISKDRAVVRVEAHTDSSGDNARNAALSTQRADVVRLALIARGVSPELLIAVGRGEVAPVASNVTARGRELNRRIEFLVNPAPTTTPTTTPTQPVASTSAN